MKRNHVGRAWSCLLFSASNGCVAVTVGDDLRGLGACHQQAFWQEYSCQNTHLYGFIRKDALLAGYLYTYFTFD